MRDLELPAFNTSNCMFLPPIELERVARTKDQAHKPAAPRRLWLSLPSGPPGTRKSRNMAIGPVKASNHQSGMHLLQRTQLPALFACLRLQPAGLSAKGSGLLCRSDVVDRGSIVPAFRYLLKVLRDSPARCATSRIGRFSRNALRRTLFRSPLCITPISPAALCSGGMVTWVTSQWKSCCYSGHFQVEVNRMDSILTDTMRPGALTTSVSGMPPLACRLDQSSGLPAIDQRRVGLGRMGIGLLLQRLMVRRLDADRVGG